MEFTEKNLKARYDELCAKRDAVYASQKSLEADLAVLNLLVLRRQKLLLKLMHNGMKQIGLL